MFFSEYHIRNSKANPAVSQLLAPYWISVRQGQSMVFVLEAQKALFPKVRVVPSVALILLFSLLKRVLGTNFKCFIGFMVLTYCDIPQQLKHR